MPFSPYLTNKCLLLTQFIMLMLNLGFPVAPDGKESTPGSGRSPGAGNGYPLQHSCLENSMGRGDLAEKYLSGFSIVKLLFIFTPIFFFFVLRNEDCKEHHVSWNALWLNPYIETALLWIWFLSLAGCKSCIAVFIFI